MMEVLSQLFEKVFDTFGMFGLLLLATIPMSLVTIVLILVMLVKIIISARDPKPGRSAKSASKPRS